MGIVAISNGDRVMSSFEMMTVVHFCKKKFNYLLEKILLQSPEGVPEGLQYYTTYLAQGLQNPSRAF